jgi:pimeloyl-ACP methyl ester carboxylesterase
MTTVEVRHGKSRLALHQVRDGDGPAALSLHGLGENARCVLTRELVEGWPGGAVWALDFLGHGESIRPAGGGYTSETLMADADAALRHIGPATVFGRGIGGYVALLIGGARPDLVQGTVICDGPGIAGGGPSPSSPAVVTPIIHADTPPDAPDPFALFELARDVRPADYAATFARQIITLSPLELPITVVAVSRPDWLEAVLEQPDVQTSTLAQAMQLYGKTKV